MAPDCVAIVAGLFNRSKSGESCTEEDRTVVGDRFVGEEDQVAEDGVR